MSDLYGVSRRRLIGEAWFWVVMFVLVVAVIGIGAWGFSVLTAPVAGQAGAFKQQQSTLNRVQQQAKFEQIAADYDGYLVQIKNAKIALKTASATTRDQRETELIGLRQVCVSTAQDFNAESRKYLARVWKSAGLPETLNPSACSG